MSANTPWQPPYDQLLQQLQQRYGGEIIPPPKPASGDCLEVGDLYPPFSTLRFTAEGTGLMINMSSDYQLFVYAIGHVDAEFKVYPRGFIERLQAFLGLGGAVRSHNPNFDRRFATNTDARDKIGLLRNSEVQQLIRSLMPFALLKFYEGGLYLVRDIGADADLDVDVIENTIAALVKLLKIAS